MYVEMITFERGVFLKREPPFFSKTAFAVYDKVVKKYHENGAEVLVALRNDNHTLVKAWTNMKPIMSLKEQLSKAKAKPRGRY